jgi:hypothetical protein
MRGVHGGVDDYYGAGDDGAIFEFYGYLFAVEFLEELYELHYDAMG